MTILIIVYYTPLRAPYYNYSHYSILHRKPYPTLFLLVTIVHFTPKPYFVKGLGAAMRRGFGLMLEGFWLRIVEGDGIKGF